MRSAASILIPLLIGANLAGCASDGVSRKDVKTQITIRYAIVQEVEEVELESEAGKTAAIGGLWGLAAGSGGDRYDMLGGAAIGAALLGLTTKIAEGSNQATAYVLSPVKGGDSFKVITDDKHAQVGDCVAVETGRTTNLRRVSQSLCGETLNHRVEQEIMANQLEEADECDQAKQALLKAETQEDIDAGVKKVKALCQY